VEWILEKGGSKPLMSSGEVQVSKGELERFEMYLFEMDDVLEDFIATASAEGFFLDYSPDSLATPEDYWLTKKSAPDSDRIFQRAVRYLGEVFRRARGGRWQLCVSHPNNLYFKLPVLVGYNPAQPHLEFCPLVVFTNFTKRERRGMLRTAVYADLPASNE
jgi:hypothetical protein